ncbi:site-2 protease family protein [Rohdeia mirabilis]
MNPEPGTYTLGHLFGIPIRASGSFLYVASLLALFAIVGSAGQGFEQAALLALLLVSLVLHELGHALVARRFGVRVLDIKLWHLGGMARMSEIPETPRVEATIAAAGPAVNIGLALAATPLLLTGPALGATGLGIVTSFIGMNLLLGVLNLLPAFPMDGGRVLRALLASRRSYLEATEIATRVGRWLALAMVIVLTVRFGFLGFVLSILVAGFVWVVGTKELLSVRVRHTGSPFGAQGFARAFGGGNPFQAAGSSGGPFGGFGPIGGGDGAAAGPREAAATGTAAHPGANDDLDAAAHARHPRGARRPAVDADAGREPGESSPSRGFSDEDVRRLESFRGPLNRRAD